MNILYIVGNGLDIQYGLKTKYSDFYEYQLAIYKERQNNDNYSNVIYDNILIDEKNKWQNWSDLELALGELTRNLEVDEEEFMKALEEVGLDLNNYLHSVQDNFDLEEKNINIEEDIKNVLHYIPEGLKGKLTEYIEKNYTSFDYVKILSCNYTNILDKLIEKVKNITYKSFRNNSSGCFINDVVHAHGTLDFSPILGLSDESQFNKDYKLSNKKYLIKESMLQEVRENGNVKNSQLLDWADIIIIFGMSIGATDKYIWKKISENSIKNNIPIIIHYYEKDIELIKRSPRRLGNLYEGVENNFIEKSEIEDKVKIEILKNNIFPIISKKVFEIID